VDTTVAARAKGIASAATERAVQPGTEPFTAQALAPYERGPSASPSR
jgi:hypothetical protein